ncbi:hypothetical protein BCD49_19740 [Pseudofrankia sp. EUN1h]|nr:hypothetical protein BCD49_19740 [Pseudofrankia sp. EUN1h]
MECRVVVAQMEELEVNLVRHQDRLPAEPLEYAALLERTETVTEEARWIETQLAKLAGREQRRASGRNQSDASGPTPS